MRITVAQSLSYFWPLWPHGLQHVKLSCPSLSSRVDSNSCPVSWWCYPTISSSVTLFSSCPQSFPVSESFPVSQFFTSGGQSIGVSAFPMNVSLSNEYSGLISFRVDWLDLLAVQGTLESFPTPLFKSINSLALSFLYSPALTSVHDYWKNHSFDYTDLCQQSNVSAFW